MRRGADCRAGDHGGRGRRRRTRGGGRGARREGPSSLPCAPCALSLTRRRRAPRHAHALPPPRRYAAAAPPLPGPRGGPPPAAMGPGRVGPGEPGTPPPTLPAPQPGSAGPGLAGSGPCGARHVRRGALAGQAPEGGFPGARVGSGGAPEASRGAPGRPAAGRQGVAAAWGLPGPRGLGGCGACTLDLARGVGMGKHVGPRGVGRAEQPGSGLAGGPAVPFAEVSAGSGTLFPGP